MVSEAVIASLSVATTVIVFSPSVSVMVLLQVSVPSAVSPFTVTLAIPESSEAVPDTVISGVLTVEPSVCDVMVMTGGVVSKGTSVILLLKSPPLFTSSSVMVWSVTLVFVPSVALNRNISLAFRSTPDVSMIW